MGLFFFTSGWTEKLKEIWKARSLLPMDPNLKNAAAARGSTATPFA